MIAVSKDPNIPGGPNFGAYQKFLSGARLRCLRYEFEYKIYGRKLHADVNGSLNLRECFLAGWNRLHCGNEQALRRQVEKFLENLFSERFKCLWSKARGLLTQNPYFLKVLSDSSKPEAWIIAYFKDICPC